MPWHIIELIVDHVPNVANITFGGKNGEGISQKTKQAPNLCLKNASPIPIT